MPSTNPTVAVGLSGGVDSAVTAKLLLDAGYNIQPVFMRNWHDAADDHCQADQDLADAKAVCDALQCRLEVVDLSTSYRDRVFEHMLRAYQAGLTPNPDVLCNQEIKFKAFAACLFDMGYPTLATGHYAAVHRTDEGTYQLRRGVDRNKDQTYFLCRLNQQQLATSLFPLGEHTKPNVRAMAAAWGLPNARKKDSTGICFIGERPFQAFLAEHLNPTPGQIVDDQGTVLGEHPGLPFFTLGQRKGLRLGGQRGRLERPWYVVQKNEVDQKLVVSQDPDHPLLWTQTVSVHSMHWIANHPPATDHPLSCQVRHRQQDVPCGLIRVEGDQITVEFGVPQRAVTPGQYLVLYDGPVCLGGGVIDG